MMFWLSIAAFTLVAIFLAFRPALRSLDVGERENLAMEYAHDIAVYRHQLTELESERQNGAISETEAKQAHAEIARRLIAAQARHDTINSEPATRASRQSHTIALAAIAAIFVPVFTVLIYLGLGSPGMEAQPLAARLDALQQDRVAQDAESQQMRELVAKAETHLDANPQDGRGWDVLAPIYYRLGEDEKAENAYRNAIRILGATATRLSGLGEVLVAKSGGAVTGEAATLFQTALKASPADARSMYFLALIEMQQGNIDQARSLWQVLAQSNSADPNWRRVASQTIERLDEAQAANGQDTTRPPMLDAQTMENAGQMDAGSRNEMIAGMVAKLDERLSGDGGTIDDWKRLIRARSVLGDNAKTADALSRALAAFSGKPVETDDLKAFAQSLGVEVPAGGIQ